MTNKSILALDLGEQTGWALIDRKGTVHSGSQSFRGSRYDGAGMRYLRFSRWLNLVAAPDGPSFVDLIAVEEVRRHLGVDAAHAYGGYLSQVQVICESCKTPITGVPVGTIKKFITGAGNAGKAAVMDAVIDRGYRPTDHNEADALALLLYAMEHL